MRKFIGSVLCAALAVFAVLGVSGCKKSGGDSLYVGTNAEFAPFEYLDNGTIVGFDIELINEIGRLIGKEIVIKNMAFDGLLPAMQAKKIDIIIAGMTADDERRKSVNFTDPYFTSKQAILIDSGTEDIKTFEDLPGRDVGVVLGYTGDMVVTDIPEVKVQRYNATSEAIMALNAKKVDAVVLDYEPAKNYAKYNENLKLIETDLAREEYSIAVPKDQGELLGQINKALETIKGNGTYDRLMSKYFNE